jgi:hypothetical protein
MDPDIRNLLVRARALLTGVAADDDEPRATIAGRLRADIHAKLIETAPHPASQDEKAA